jgi:hypothetical protein
MQMSFGRAISIFLIFLFGKSVLAGEASAWKVLTEIHSSKDSLQLIFNANDGDAFKGCRNKLKIDIEKYDSFKWDFVARITGSVRPESKESIDSLLTKLTVSEGKAIYMAERSPLKRIADCHFVADGATLEGNFLSLYFKLFYL